MGIVWVVAALTLPALIQNTQKELEAGLKKGASEIAQALNMYQAEHGEPITSYIEYHNLKSEIIKYFNIIEDCGFGKIDSNTACIKNYLDTDKNSTTYKNFNGSGSINLNLFDDGQFVLSDGSLVLMENFTPGTVYISIDVNGYSKRPNRLGQDLFMFQLDNQGKLISMGAEGTTYYSSNDAYCSKTSTSDMNGAGCTYKALSDPSFWKNLP